MLVVGLTGGIASGKSTVSRLFQEAGIPVICADELAREAVKRGSAGLEEIRRVFGNTVFDSDGALDRKVMASVIFGDESKRKILESIIHPRVEEAKTRILNDLERHGHLVVIVDVPLLYESGWQTSFDLVIVVYVPREVQEQRLISRDGISLEEAIARIRAQLPIEKKKQLADRVVDNTGDVAHTHLQVRRLLEEFRVMAQKRKPSDRTD